MPFSYCPRCGAAIAAGSPMCTRCGYSPGATAPSPTGANSSGRAWLVAGIVIAALFVIAVVFLSVGWGRWMARQSERYRAMSAKQDIEQTVFSLVVHYPPALDALGAPIRRECCYDIQLSELRAHASIPISGSRGKGKLRAELHYNGDDWVFDSFALVPEVGPELQLLPTRTAAPVSELQGSGRIYFVPIGTQAVPIERLARHYKEKYGLDITVLPAMPMPEGAYLSKRRQYAGEDVADAMRRAHWDLATDGSAYLIGITHDDLFMRQNGWGFTYALRHGPRTSVVSTARMYARYWNPRFGQSRGGPLSADEVREAEQTAEQMITKEIAVQYWRLPMNEDTQSVLLSTLTPHPEPDDIWTSDVHSEDTIYGRDIECLLVAYDYRAHRLQPPTLSSCYRGIEPGVDQEVIRLEPGEKKFWNTSTDLTVMASIPIEVGRMYSSAEPMQPGFGFGMGGTMSYNRAIATNDMPQNRKIAVYDFNNYEELQRVSPGTYTTPGVRFEGKKTGSKFYQAVGLIEYDHSFSITLSDQSKQIYRQCVTNEGCLLEKLRGPHGEELTVTREKSGNAVRVDSGAANVTFEYDDQHRIASAHASDGTAKQYAYDRNGCLARVERPGAVTEYQYDDHCHLTGISITDDGRKQQLLRVDYSNGLATTVVAAGQTYRFGYKGEGNDAVWSSAVLPDGRVMTVIKNGDSVVGYALR